MTSVTLKNPMDCLSDYHSVTTLMDLNGDCLLTILKYFDLLDLIKARGSCRLLDFFIDEYRYKYVNFNFDGISCDATLFHQILEFLGPVLKSLTINWENFCLTMESQFIFDKILDFCWDLEALTLVNFDLCDKLIHEILKKIMKNVKSINLRDCVFHDDLGECLFISNSGPVDIFIENNTHITSKFFQNASNLVSLGVINCPKVKFKTFKNVLMRNHTTLKRLDLRGCSKKPLFHRKIVNFFISHDVQVEYLSITSKNVDLNRILDLPHLKTLKIHKIGQRKEKITAFLEKFPTVKTSIEDLEMDFLTKSHMEMASKLKTLKKLTINYWYGFTGDDLTFPLNDNWLSANDLFQLMDGLNGNLEYIKISTYFLDFGFLEKLRIFLMNENTKRPKLEISFKKVLNDKTNEELWDLLKNLKIIKDFEMSKIRVPEDVYILEYYCRIEVNDKSYYAPHYESEMVDVDKPSAFY